jgi:uncharacterized protein (TIGR02266 family)
MSWERTILLVDDAQMFRELGALFLARTGRILTACSGEEGLAIAREQRPDVVLLDLSMPGGLDGDAICRFMKTDPDLYDIPVIMLVGGGEASAWGRAVRAGADDVLSKPLSRVSLIETVRRFIGRIGAVVPSHGPAPKGQQRIQIDSEIEFAVGERTTRGRLKNLSRGGLFIETGFELPANAEVKLQFALPDNSADFDPTAHVIWKQLDSAKSRSRGIGMRFVDISSQQVRDLEDYIYDRALDPNTQVQGETA